MTSTDDTNPSCCNDAKADANVVAMPGRDKFMSGLQAETLLRKTAQRLKDDNHEAVKSLFAQYSKQTSDVIIKSTNDIVGRLDQKYKQMFGFLVNKALNEMESRLHGCEIAIDALIEVTASRIATLAGVCMDVPSTDVNGNRPASPLEAFTGDFKTDIETVGKRIMQEREELRKKQEAEAHARAVAAADKAAEVKKAKEATTDAQGTTAEQPAAQQTPSNAN